MRTEEEIEAHNDAKANAFDDLGNLAREVCRDIGDADDFAYILVRYCYSILQNDSCDHDVNICYCEDWHRMLAAARFLDKDKLPAGVRMAIDAEDQLEMLAARESE